VCCTQPVTRGLLRLYDGLRRGDSAACLAAVVDVARHPMARLLVQTVVPLQELTTWRPVGCRQLVWQLVQDLETGVSVHELHPAELNVLRYCMVGGYHAGPRTWDPQLLQFEYSRYSSHSRPLQGLVSKARHTICVPSFAERLLFCPAALVKGVGALGSDESMAVVANLGWWDAAQVSCRAAMTAATPPQQLHLLCGCPCTAGLFWSLPICSAYFAAVP
jgi:hypothetical protein